MSNPKHPIYGEMWWDLDDKMHLGIECEHPPTDKHYLCYIPYTGKFCDKAIEVAEVIMRALGRELANDKP